MKTIIDVRKYWNKRPCNIRHSPKEVGTLAWSNEVSKRKYFIEPHIKEFAKHSEWAGKKVLEIGCGIGTDTLEFAKAGAQVTAVDLSKESLILAAKRMRLHGLEKNVRFFCGNAEELSKFVPKDTFDLVYSFGVIHHSPNPRKIVEEVQKFMGAHTQFKLMVYNRDSWKVLWIIIKYGWGAFWNKDKLIAKYSEAQTGCPITYSYTWGSIRELLEGFYIQDMRVDHIFPWVIPEYKEYRYKKVWYFRWMPHKWFRKLEKKYGWHMCVTCYPMKSNA